MTSQFYYRQAVINIMEALRISIHDVVNGPNAKARLLYYFRVFRRISGNADEAAFRRFLEWVECSHFGVLPEWAGGPHNWSQSMVDRVQRLSPKGGGALKYIRLLFGLADRFDYEREER